MGETSLSQSGFPRAPFQRTYNILQWACNINDRSAKGSDRRRGLNNTFRKLPWAICKDKEISQDGRMRSSVILDLLLITATVSQTENVIQSPDIFMNLFCSHISKA